MYTDRAGYARLPSATDTDWVPNYWRPDRPDDWRPPSGSALFQTSGSYASPTKSPQPCHRARPLRVQPPVMMSMQMFKAAAQQSQQLALQHLRTQGGMIRVALLRKLTGWDRQRTSEVGKALSDKQQIIRQRGIWLLYEFDKKLRLLIAPPMIERRHVILEHLRAHYPNPLVARDLAVLTGLSIQQIRNTGAALARDHLISREMGKWRALPFTETDHHE